MTELELLKRKVARLRAVYHACVAAAQKSRQLPFIHGWLADAGLALEELERQIAPFVGDDEKKTPPPSVLRAAWRNYYRAFAALEPTNASPALTPDAQTQPEVTLAPVANRLRIVYVFLALQLVAGAGLLGYTVWLFGRFDPYTALNREQIAARVPARAHVARLRSMLEAAVNAPPAPQPAAAPGSGAPGGGGTQPDDPAAHDQEDPRKVALRAEVEGVLAVLADLPLATSDLKLANAVLDNLLTSLDADVTDYGRALQSIVDLERALGFAPGEEPPSVVWTIVLGSLLGMITITIHLNWKFRNQWETAGFVPWYLTKLLAAPVISLAAAGFLSQVRFAQDAPAGEISNLGLLGASPLLLLGIAIVSGLFSNRMFEWLKDTVTRVQRPAAPRPSSEEPRGGAGGSAADKEPAEAQ